MLLQAVRSSVNFIKVFPSCMCHLDRANLSNVRLRISSSNYSTHSGPKGVSLSYASYESTSTECSRAPVVILHGLFGSKNNWKSISKSMVRTTGRKVYALDTRNHGDSPHTEDMDYLLMATDLELFCKERGLQEAAILGHSMGGRVAMTFALTRPSMVERLVVVDVAPTFMPTTVDGEVLTYLRAMRETLKHISPEMSSPAARKEAERHLGSVVQEYGVLQFLLTNLRKGEHSYEWQFNAETLESCMRNITQMPELKGLTYDGRVLFICGRNSIFVSISNMHAAVESQQAMQQGRASRSNQGTVSESRHRVRGKRRPLGPSRQTRRISRAGHQLLER
ncbi:protein ABHD11 isoform X1 [Ixodes scapularis]|uniref:protein ABHD11 isoform X1 n=1 Tax=Ixodes scapularis TaxID=6945 RepID=UPI001A9EB531|nr:protein ABHD11 isoform X1 [Ixodes scapularis]